jgi:hypothetical protein
MKINLPNHKIIDVERMDARDIPVGYIDTTDASYDISFTLSEDFSTNERKQVFAYDVFNDRDILLFDKDNKLLNNVRYKREGNTYIYEPAGCTEFQPAYFQAQALIRRRMQYRSDAHYNLKVGVIETNDKFSFASSIIPAFGDANKRGLCPGNITVNSGNKTFQSLLSATTDTADFIFLQSPDGIDTNGLDIDNALRKHVNIWMSVDEFGSMLVTPKAGMVPTKEGHLCSFYKETDRQKYPPRVFDDNADAEHAKYPRAAYDYSMPYEDVLLLHKKNGGYIIVTPSEFLVNTPSNIKVIYDIMMYVFMNGYKSVLSEETWITNELVDYMSYNYMPINSYHKSINLNKMLATPDYDLGGEYDIISIASTTPNISCVKITPDKTLFFRKSSKAETDPKKATGTISYITTKETVLIYEPEDIYKVKTRAELIGKNEGATFTAILNPLMDSEKHVYVPEPVSIQIPDPNKEWYICVKGCTPDSTSDVKLVEKNRYSMRNNGYIVAEIHIGIEQKPQVIDTRVYGGGVPVGEEDNYDCIDIGNISGRPYRLGSTVIIKLPRRLKEHEDIITEAVKEHVAAGEYPVILFE